MALAKTTIMADEVLIDRVESHTKSTKENLKDFYTRAIVNQLEKDGDFEIRDELEELENGN